MAWLLFRVRPACTRASERVRALTRGGCVLRAHLDARARTITCWTTYLPTRLRAAAALLLRARNARLLACCISMLLRRSGADCVCVFVFLACTRSTRHARKNTIQIKIVQSRTRCSQSLARRAVVADFTHAHTRVSRLVGWSTGVYTYRWLKVRFARGGSHGRKSITT